MINKFGRNFTDLLFHSLANMKRFEILSVTFNMPEDTISVISSEGTLMLHPNQYPDPEEDNRIATYNYVHSSDYNGEGLNFNASYSPKKKFKEICSSAINVARDLHDLLMHYSKLPRDPPMRDKTVFSKKEGYRKALIEHLKEISNDNEFRLFKGAQRITVNQIERNSLEPVTKVSIRVQKGNDFSVTAKKLAENIYQSVNGEVNEQINKVKIKKIFFFYI